MKAIKKFIVLAAAAIGLSSCVGDLDLKPTDPRTLTAADFAKDPEDYMDRVMANVQMAFATYGANGNSPVAGFDGGMATFQRATFILEEIPTDEANWIATSDADYGQLQYGIPTASVKFIEGTYSRYIINVTFCNQFIQTVNDGYFNLDESLKPKADEYIRQCKILRSACYFYLVDCFGNVPYADENTAVGSIAPQLPREEIFTRVTQTLEDIVKEYEANPVEQRYGYVGVDVARALLVKFYLNAEVYTGTPAWDKCLAHSKAIIDRLKGPGFKGSGLANVYQQLFAVNNDQYTIGGSNAVNEIIWGIPQEMPNLLSWANGTFMVAGWLGASKPSDSWQCSFADYNVTDGWKCMTTRRQFVEKFDWNEATMATSPDDRVRDWKTSKDGFSPDAPALDLDNFGSNGYLPMKFTNWALDAEGKRDTDLSPVANNQNGIDYPVIRLAEIYLSAAEAILHGAGDKAEALTYVNYIRERALLSPWTSGELSLNSLQDERCRELYTENCRRTDLIRYGKYTSGYNWNWKNQVPGGADLPAHFNLYPLPSSIVYLGGYTQNPGY